MRKRHMVAGSDSSIGTFEDEYEKAEKIKSNLELINKILYMKGASEDSTHR